MIVGKRAHQPKKRFPKKHRSRSIIRGIKLLAHELAVRNNPVSVQARDLNNTHAPRWWWWWWCSNKLHAGAAANDSAKKKSKNGGRGGGLRTSRMYAATKAGGGGRGGGGFCTRDRRVPSRPAARTHAPTALGGDYNALSSSLSRAPPSPPPFFHLAAARVRFACGPTEVY